MSDTEKNGRENGGVDLGVCLRAARERAGMGREYVAARLDPPISSKTLERWEVPGAVFQRIDRRRFYLRQFEEMYGEKVA